MSKEKKAKEPKAVKTKSGKKKRGGLWFTLFLLACMVLLRQSSGLLLVGILPSIVSFVVDDTPRRAWFKTVFAFNLSGVLPYVFNLFFLQGNSARALQHQMSDFTMWLIIYGCAAAGWVVLWICPQVMEVLLRYHYVSRIDFHQKKKADLAEEYRLEAQAE